MLGRKRVGEKPSFWQKESLNQHIGVLDAFKLAWSLPGMHTSPCDAARIELLKALEEHSTIPQVLANVVHCGFHAKAARVPREDQA